MSYRVGLVGLGYFSQFHLASWAAHPQAVLVGVADINAQRRAWAKDEFGVADYENLVDLMAENLDILDIVTPPSAHAGLIKQALGKMRVIICQKPFCTSLTEATEMVALADRSDTTLIIHENFRFQPWYRSIKNLLDHDFLGQIYAARSTLRAGDGRGPDAYLARQPSFQTMPQFLIHETGVHFIDLFRWMFGDIHAVYADTRRLNPAIIGEDAGVLIIDHTGGIQTVFDGNRLSDHATDNPRRTMGEMEIEGTKGTLRLNGYGQIRFRKFGTENWQDQPLQHPVDDAAFGGGCVAALNDHVIAAQDGKTAFENTAREYLAVVRTEVAAYQSAKEGRKINV